jgi:hypothetical protein
MCLKTARCRYRRRTDNKENIMLRTFAAALIATALVAGPAFAQNSGTAPANQASPPQKTPNAPAASTAPVKPAGKSTAPVKPAGKSTKSVKHSVKHARKHHASHVRKHSAPKKTSARMHQTRHMKSGNAHAAGAAMSGQQS